MNMIERVARAMCISEGLDPDILCHRYMPQVYSNGLFVAPNEQSCFPAWRFNIVVVKAAIEAMRQPTDLQRNEYFKEMQSSGWSNGDSVFDDATWERMIDAALKEE